MAITDQMRPNNRKCEHIDKENIKDRQRNVGRVQKQIVSPEDKRTKAKLGAYRLAGVETEVPAA